ncbi:MAG: 2Fe-2S iron-sulfur cluster-binding protein [Cyclobacteriaceae bacterium]
MPQFVISNLFNKTLQVNGKFSNLLKEIHANQIDWMHACGGKGRCTTCKFVVEEGAENLSELTENEMRYQKVGQLKKNERLACQVMATGDARVSIPEEGKFPHMKYSD